MISGSTRGPPRSIRTPTPFGPPNLWPDNAIRSTSGVISRRSTHEAACTASVCSKASGACRRTTSETAAMSVRVPTSLLTVMTLTIVTSSRSCSVWARWSRSTRPAPSTPTTTPPWCSTTSSTAWCSTDGQTATPPDRASAPVMAVLSLSVPHPVNTTSFGRQPSTSATVSRASSTARRATRAKRCEPDGLA